MSFRFWLEHCMVVVLFFLMLRGVLVSFLLLPPPLLSQAVVPLMRYLEKELQYMHENLVQENFNRYLRRHHHRGVNPCANV